MDLSGKPSATYRLQFNSGFTFRDARVLVPYLHQLGVSHVYASPIFKARKGSTHGYDVIDPTQLNPELGTTSDFLELVGALKSRGMGLIIDIVPNHMAASLENPWWRDVLENGPTSRYASFFDIHWQEAERTEASPLILPILGRTYEDALASHEFSLDLDNDGFHISYLDRQLPVEARAHGLIFEQCLSSHSAGLSPEETAGLRRLVSRTRRLSPWQTTGPRGSHGRRSAASRIKEDILVLVASSLSVDSAFREAAHVFNSDTGGLTTGGLLDRLLAQQPYQLTYWRDGSRTLNYRRFFDINDLAGIRVEDPVVFEETHSLIFEMAAQGQISGIRIDHIDGLKHPAAYLRRLRRHLGAEFYASVEKILAHDERLTEGWPIQGTTGYEFMNRTNGLFVDPGGLEKLTCHYREVVGSEKSFHDVAYEGKKSAARRLFPGELNRLAKALVKLSDDTDSVEHPTVQQFEQVLLEVTSCLPVYRTYFAGVRRTPEDLKWTRAALGEAVRRSPDLDPPAMDFLRRVLAPNGQEVPVKSQDALSEFVSRWQQFTGPLTAKGVEDTALYVHTPLSSVNEVGSDPGHCLTPLEGFHGFCQERQASWPMSMSATSTHDTKRSEDVRARLNPLSEVPDLWRQHFQRWTGFNLGKKERVQSLLVPTVREEWLLYQTLLGVWPLNDGDLPEFKTRIKEYTVKAARESNTGTSWLEPDAEHEAALHAFVDSILSETNDNRFLPDFLDLQRRVVFWGFLNSLSQVVLKLTAPGVPDIYQGTETWDFSLVDPDNRRAVDFEYKKRLLADLYAQESPGHNTLRGLLAGWQDGLIKLFVTSKALAFRNEHRTLFSQGSYTPINTQGTKSENICAFVRQHDRDWSITVVPRLVTELNPDGVAPTGEDTWMDTQLRLPDGAPTEWLDVFSGAKIHLTDSEQELRAANVLQHLPIALLHGEI